MFRNERASRFIELLEKNPNGLHKRNLKRKLLIGSDTTFYRILAAARLLAQCNINCLNETYSLSSAPQLAVAGPFIPSDDELISLVSLQQILLNMTSGSLNDVFEPLRHRLAEYLVMVDKKAGAWPSRIKILDIHYRRIDEGVFKHVLTAAAHRYVIRFTYTYAHGRKTERDVSPQQIVRYKDNWYLDAWCHTGNDLRIFSLDSISAIRQVNRKYIVVAPGQLKHIYATSYGIFSGVPTAVAVVRFSGLAARYALRELWHPKQKLTQMSDGTVELSIPFNKPQELIREILARGTDAEVIAPQELREEVAKILEETAAKYRKQGL